MDVCKFEHIGLALLSVALLISLCLNVIFCFRQRTILCRDECCYPHIYEGERSRPQDEGHYFHNLNNDEEQENPHNHHEQQENPIYGNIRTDRTEVCYEMMTTQHTRDRMKSLEPDLNYASLDLKVAKKHKKKQRHQQGPALQDQLLPAHLTPPGSALLEVEADMEAQLPSRDTSTMVSHSSIYLNSQQIAQETEMRRWDDGENREWREGQESEERKDISNGSVCMQLSEIEAIQIGTDHFISSLSHDSEQ